MNHSTDIVHRLPQLHPQHILCHGASDGTTKLFETSSDVCFRVQLAERGQCPAYAIPSVFIPLPRQPLVDERVLVGTAQFVLACELAGPFRIRAHGVAVGGPHIGRGHPTVAVFLDIARERRDQSLELRWAAAAAAVRHGPTLRRR